MSTGKGSELFDYARTKLIAAGYDGMLLWTLEDNARARQFYQNRGLQLDGAKHDDPEWLGEGVYEVRYVLSFAKDQPATV